MEASKESKICDFLGLFIERRVTRVNIVNTEKNKHWLHRIGRHNREKIFSLFLEFCNHLANVEFQFVNYLRKITKIFCLCI